MSDWMAWPAMLSVRRWIRDQVAHAGNAGDDGAAREFPGHRREPTGQPEAALEKECPQRKGSDEGAAPVEHLAHERLLQIVTVKVRTRLRARPIVKFKFGS